MKNRGIKNRLDPLWLAVLPLAAAVAVFFVVPYGAAFWKAVTTPEGIPLWGNTALLRITFFTVKQAFLSVLVSLVLGLPGAWLIGSGKSRFSPLVRAVTAIPFAMPSILVVLGFVP